MDFEVKININYNRIYCLFFQHVHVHVLPRKTGDFERPDDIYDHIHKHDTTDERPCRSREDMVEECKQLRKYFY